MALHCLARGLVLLEQVQHARPAGALRRALGRVVEQKHLETSARHALISSVSGRWVYLYRAIDQFGQVIDVLVSEKRDLAATCRFFIHELGYDPSPPEVTIDRAPAYPRVLDELLPAACHVTEQDTNDPIEADHGRLKSRLRRDARAQTAALSTK